MVDDRALNEFVHAIASGDAHLTLRMLEATPQLAVASVVRGATRDEARNHFLDDCGVYLYAGHTALHVAAAAYDVAFARTLLDAGADVRARNRRGAEPLHEAARGGPGSVGWDPARQSEMVSFLVSVGADPNAVAAGGVTPLHRAVRNRCSSAVRALLISGADPRRPNDKGSTPIMLTRWTTGRGGSGSPEAKAEQREIVSLLTAALA